jgi:hypothetical protein
LRGKGKSIEKVDVFERKALICFESEMEGLDANLRSYRINEFRLRGED